MINYPSLSMLPTRTGGSEPQPTAPLGPSGPDALMSAVALVHLTVAVLLRGHPTRVPGGICTGKLLCFLSEFVDKLRVKLLPNEAEGLQQSAWL